MKRFIVVAVIGALWALLPAFAQTGQCDRVCLDKLVDSYLAAVVAHDVAHDPTRVSIAPGAKFVENTMPMKPGDGLWKTASEAPTTFKIYVPDPVAEQVGFIGVMKENGKPVELALRLKVHNGQIVEMEHLIARNLRDFERRQSANAAPGPARHGPARRTGAARDDAENRRFLL